MKIILAGLMILSFALSTTQSLAKSRTIAGQWKGAGSISSSSGSERTRCSATIKARSNKRYSVYAKCAVAALGMIEQRGTVRRVGKNRYRGRFTNEEYDIQGSIHITLRGNRQIVTLRSSSGRAHLVLRRRR